MKMLPEGIPAAVNGRKFSKAALDSGGSLWHSGDMDRGSVLQTLRQHEPELQAAGILHLRLFGSVARGDSSSHSDVDLIADFDRSMRLTLFDMARLEGRLSDLLGGKVDLSPAGSMKERVRARALREAVHAF